MKSIYSQVYTFVVLFGIYRLSTFVLRVLYYLVFTNIYLNCQSLDVIRLFTLQPHRGAVAARAHFHFNVCRFCRCICNVRLWNPGIKNVFSFYNVHVKDSLHFLRFCFSGATGAL